MNWYAFLLWPSLHIIFQKNFETKQQLHPLNLNITNEVLLDINTLLSFAFFMLYLWLTYQFSALLIFSLSLWAKAKKNNNSVSTLAGN